VNDVAIGVVAQNSCQYYHPIAFPCTIDGGLKAVKIGKSSITYEIGIFDEKHSSLAALGSYVHVYVHRSTMKPTPIPEKIRIEVEKLLPKSE
jgi:acyl-CoA thioester hydrolase